MGLEWANFLVMRRTHSSLMNELNVAPKVVATSSDTLHRFTRIRMADLGSRRLFGGIGQVPAAVSCAHEARNLHDVSGPRRIGPPESTTHRIRLDLAGFLTARRGQIGLVVQRWPWSVPGRIGLSDEPMRTAVELIEELQRVAAGARQAALIVAFDSQARYLWSKVDTSELVAILEQMVRAGGTPVGLVRVGSGGMAIGPLTEFADDEQVRSLLERLATTVKGTIDIEINHRDWPDEGN